jgi:hypothetical protein
MSCSSDNDSNQNLSAAGEEEEEEEEDTLPEEEDPSEEEEDISFAKKDEISIRHLERRLRELLHSLRRGTDKPSPLIEVLSSLPDEDKLPEQEPHDRLKKDFYQFQELIIQSRRKYASVMPGIMLEDDLIPANFQSYEVGDYFYHILSYIERYHIHQSGRDLWLPHFIDFFHREFDRQIVNETDVGAQVRTTILPLASAIDIFVARFTDAFKYSAAMIAGSVPVTVNSVNAGYTVRYTPRWLFNISSFGSTLSTPVTDYLPPADYRFAGEKNGSPIWDRAIHTVTGPSTSTRVTAF